MGVDNTFGETNFNPDKMKEEDKKTALHKWNDVVLQLIDRNLPKPKNRRGTIERRLHVSLKEVEDLKLILTNFEIRKHRIIVDFLTDETTALSNDLKALEEQYKNLRFYQVKTKREVLDKAKDLQGQIEGMKKALLIVVNTLPQ